MRNWYPDLKRGEDLERDERLDLLFGCVEIGPSQCVVTKNGVLMGNLIREYGYDGTVISEKCSYNTRLTGMSANGIVSVAHQAGVKVVDSL